MHIEADEARLIAEHRLGGDDRLTGVGLLHGGDLVAQRLERLDEFRIALLVVGFVRRVDRNKIGDERLARRLHVARIVPEMRIVAGLVSDEFADDDLPPAGRLAGRQHLFHPGIVIDAIHDDDLRIPEGLGGVDARLEQMRVLIGAAQDAGDRDMRPADLGGHVAVEVLRRDDPDGIGESRRGHERGGKAKRREARKDEELAHRVSDGSLERQAKCYVITVRNARPWSRQRRLYLVGFRYVQSHNRKFLRLRT